MTPRVRRFVLTLHVVSSVGWIGAVVAYLALVAAALSSENDQTVRAAFLAMELTYLVLVPLALASLWTGIVQSLGSTWGLFRHYWVVFKFLLTIISTLVLLGNMSTVSSLADAAAAGVDLPDAGGQLLHAGVGQVVLLMTAILAVYKPRGVTPYGQRKLHELRTRMRQEERRAQDEQRTPAVPSMRRSLLLIAVLLVVLLAGVAVVAGYPSDPAADESENGGRGEQTGLRVTVERSTFAG